MRTLPCLSAVALVLALGCVDETRAPAAPAAPKVQAGPAAPSPAALPVDAQGAGPKGKVPAPSELPVPEDFEANVEATIRPDNYKTRLAELEREVARDAVK